MTRIEPPFRSDQPNILSEPFCTYLAKQFIAKKGFEIASVPEAQDLAGPGDILLTYSDGYTFTILCMIDRETYPGATFDLDADRVRQIGEACRPYNGKVNRRKMPAYIRIMEVGPGSADQPQRLKLLKRSSLLSKVIPSAMVVDTTSGEVWNSDKNWISKGGYHHFVQQLLTAPREADADLRPPVFATAPATFPILTVAIIAVLAAVFAAELVYGIGPWTKAFEPTIATLVAFGGLSRNLVLQSGEWYRLFSAPFLHLDAGHLAINAVTLFIAGHALERLVGRAWLGAVYVIGALSGSLLSLVLNPASIVAVGASGAIMGLFAAMPVVSLHFPPGALRTGLQTKAAYVLIPSLLPLAGALKGAKVDYAAHFGGAIGGAVVGLILLGIWSRNEAWPGFRQVAAAIAIAGLVTLTYPAISILNGYQAVAFTTKLIPSDKLPKTNADMRVHAAELIAQYPHDPRPHLIRAADLLDAKDPTGAEREARAGLAEEDMWRSLLLPQLGNSFRVVLAIAIDNDRHDEALQTARPACAAMKEGALRKLLDDRKLCAT